ncbi:hypothetical protein [Fodinicola feengrottensis]|uniref:hypothetical protein n=1 Tax=Fodinicola feengrottensis TaxID=435914 RepID=UPI0013D46815|nr:hypothetical protein [Fodinicola feengrottensis]
MADFVFEPLMKSGGGLSGSIGQLLGVGHGRGIGLEFVIFGIACVVVAIWGISSRPLTGWKANSPTKPAPECGSGYESARFVVDLG